MHASPRDPRLERLLARQAESSSRADDARIAADYEIYVSEHPEDTDGLVLRNRFRLVRPGAGAPRPRVLCGATGDPRFPDAHARALLAVADVVFLRPGAAEGLPEVLAYDSWNDRLEDVLDRLPAGFAPDLYLDRVEEAHVLPMGLEEAPFPTVALLVDAADATRNLWLAELFDVLVAPTSALAAALAHASGKPVLEPAANPGPSARDGDAPRAPGPTLAPDPAGADGIPPSEELYRRLLDQVAQHSFDWNARPDRGRAYFALGAAYGRSADDATARRSLLALPGILRQPLEQRVANLLALLPRLIDWYGTDAMLDVLGREESIARAFADGTREGVEALFAILPEHPVVRWNRTILTIEAGRATTAMVRETLGLLETAREPFDPRDLLVLTPRLPYLTELERSQVASGLFHRRATAAYGDEDATLEVHLAFMRWHCLRWLLEHEGDAAADRLRQCLELCADDSVLQLALAERLHDGDPDAARRAYEHALRLDPGCEPARRALGRSSSASAA